MAGAVHPLLPLAAAAATGVQVGAALVASRFVVDQTGPASLALMRYAIGYWLWLWAFKHASPTRVAAFLALSPVTAALLGAVLLDEPLTPALAGGVACVVAGLVVAGLVVANRPVPGTRPG